jgi:arsenate reductase
MKKFYSLGSCNTCQRILGQLNLGPDFELKDIKKKPITTEELVQLKALSGSYEALFSKRAMLYKELGLKEKNLSEVDFKGYILEHYTFLKRPVLVFNDTIFIGNSAKVTEAAQTALLNEK